MSQMDNIPHSSLTELTEIFHIKKSCSRLVGRWTVTYSGHILQTSHSPVLLPEVGVELQLVCQAVGGVGGAQSLYGSEVDHVVAGPDIGTDKLHQTQD